VNVDFLDGKPTWSIVIPLKETGTRVNVLIVNYKDKDHGR
jgi:hypothetical protein